MGLLNTKFMNTEELEKILNGGIETQRIEFKSAIVWDVKKFVKSMMAMSNLRDGGYIIVGVKDDGVRIVREGITDELAKTYKIDEMKDKLRKFTDPSIDFSIMNIIKAAKTI